MELGDAIARALRPKCQPMFQLGLPPDEISDEAVDWLERMLASLTRLTP